MRDLPTGPTLLGLARDILLTELLPLLPPESRLDARLVANSMAIAEREAAAGEGPKEHIGRALDVLHTGVAPALTLPRERGREREGAGSSLPRERGRAGVGATGEGDPAPLRRFAQDLRAGAFEGSERQARDILWRLTIAKLRLANPRFLAANGFR